MSYIKKYSAVVLLLMVLMASSCRKYVTVGLGGGKLSIDQEYSSDASATSAVLELYSYTYTTSLLINYTYTGGLQSDELQNTTNNPTLNEFQTNTVTVSNGNVQSPLWQYSYLDIGIANLAIDNLAKSPNVSAATKAQLTGECKFFRAFCFFNLVNYFGAVPLSLDPLQLNNALIPRISTDSIWAQIKKDLVEAESGLPETYAGTAGTKARVNKWAAAALLARVYLYTKDYVNAEAEATKVINSGVYTLAALPAVFTNTSSETIFQIATTYGFTIFGVDMRGTLVTPTSIPPGYVLHQTFLTSFEANDKRDTAWMDSTVYQGMTYYRQKKYKLASVTTGNEFYVLLRLAEQYLIRAEARANSNNVSDAQTDLNSIRTRAGLPNTTASSPADLLTAIAHERKVELFAEFSHRWFDLKRTGQADAVIGALKSTWKPTAVLLPIPSNEILLNSNLTQNPGY